jgi:hypothetical protein
MKWFSKLGNPLALAVEGFLVVAFVFVAANPVVLHPEKTGATAQSDAILAELTS